MTARWQSAVLPVLVAGWVALLALALPVPSQAAADRAPLVSAVRSVGVTVSDLERSIAFYRDVLDFRPVSEFEVAGDKYEQLYGVFGLRVRVARLALGSETLELMQFLAPVGRPIPVDSRGNDRWFQHVAVIVSDMDRAYARLREHRVAHGSPGPQRLPDSNPNAGGIKAFYFRDPDGHYLEILQFPVGKGAVRWQPRSGQPLFLGIDHTAIVVADTDASLRYYQDELGLRVAGVSDNYGLEQERLNNVFGAHLRITALRAGSGPGIELLEYLSPAGGRPLPPDTRANDLWHWQVNVRAADVGAGLERLRADKRVVVSSGVTALPGAEGGFSSGLMVRDPDGHALLLEQAQ
jgi:catechol 2,3-dioxygenase-like lactoylglutathione lyase family enzyme